MINLLRVLHKEGIKIFKKVTAISAKGEVATLQTQKVDSLYVSITSTELLFCSGDDVTFIIKWDNDCTEEYTKSLAEIITHYLYG